MKLPIDAVREQVLAPFPADTPWRMLLKAPTGSGKSVGLPQILLEDEPDGMIMVVQPRRLAARMLAQRVASLRHSRLGAEVGYVVRFDHKMSSQTRLVYITDGMLQRWLEENPRLEGISAVVFDEFHERRIAMDMSLADCLELQDGERPDLQVCVMSATLELAGVEAFIEPCRVVEVDARSYPVEISYQKLAKQARGGRGPVQRDEPVWEKAWRALREVIAEPDCGNVLIFMPGVYEIRRTISLLEQQNLRGWEICPLYGALNPQQQDRAVREDGGPRIIVSTNVAETSLTIPGVKTVIDAGLARIATFDPLRGMDTLLIQKIARSATDQRAGRAGRTSAGRCIRLWSEADHAKRASFELAEIARVDLTEALLKLMRRGYSDWRKFRWLEPPSAQSADHALELLEQLGAIEQGELTEIGNTMARLPLHPRMARLLISAEHTGCHAEAVFVVSILQGESLFVRGGEDTGSAAFTFAEDTHDFAAMWRGYQSAQAMNFDLKRCQNIGVMARAARELQRAMASLQQQLERLGWQVGEIDFSVNDTTFRRAMLSAFSDQLAVRNGSANYSCRVVGKRSGQLPKESAVADAELFLVTALTEVGGKQITIYLSGCIAVDLSMLRELFPDQLVEHDGAVYDEKIRRVIRRHSLQFRDLVITQKDGGEPDLDQAAAILAERVAAGELKLKHWNAEVEQWIARLLCLREWMPELELPGFDEEDRAIALETVCHGALGYKQIKDKAVQPAIDSWLSAGQHAALDAYAPTRITLANGKSVKVSYELGKPPQIALTVQRLYGVKKSPTIANGTVTIQIHICAPNQRPWQMTQDLESFWKNGFAQMKKDLAGRYPKHNWTHPEEN